MNSVVAVDSTGALNYFLWEMKCGCAVNIMHQVVCTALFRMYRLRRVQCRRFRIHEKYLSSIVEMEIISVRDIVIVLYTDTTCTGHRR